MRQSAKLTAETAAWRGRLDAAQTPAQRREIRRGRLDRPAGAELDAHAREDRRHVRRRAGCGGAMLTWRPVGRMSVRPRLRQDAGGSRFAALYVTS